MYWDKHGIEGVSVRIGSAIERPTEFRQLSTWFGLEDLIPFTDALHRGEGRRLRHGLGRVGQHAQLLGPSAASGSAGGRSRTRRTTRPRSWPSRTRSTRSPSASRAEASSRWTTRRRSGARADRWRSAQAPSSASRRSTASLKRRKVGLLLEQADIENVIEELIYRLKRRLGHVEPCCGAPEVQLLRDGDKAAQLPQLEHRRPRRNVHLPAGPVWSTLHRPDVAGGARLAGCCANLCHGIRRRSGRSSATSSRTLPRCAVRDDHLRRPARDRAARQRPS